MAVVPVVLVVVSEAAMEEALKVEKRLEVRLEVTYSPWSAPSNLRSPALSCISTEGQAYCASEVGWWRRQETYTWGHDRPCRFLID